MTEPNPAITERTLAQQIPCRPKAAFRPELTRVRSAQSRVDDLRAHERACARGLSAPLGNTYGAWG